MNSLRLCAVLLIIFVSSMIGRAAEKPGPLLSQFIRDTMKIHAVEIFYDPKTLQDRDGREIQVNREVRLIQDLDERLKFLEALVDGQFVRLDERNIVLRVNRRDDIGFRTEARKVRERLAAVEKQNDELKAELAAQRKLQESILNQIRLLQ